MVRSKLNPDINYREYKQLERDDADYDATMYEIELLGKEVRIAIGRGKTDKKDILYYPMYLINTDDRVVKQIGVFEIRADQSSDFLDDEDDLDIDKLPHPLIYSFVTASMLEADSRGKKAPAQEAPVIQEAEKEATAQEATAQEETLAETTAEEEADQTLRSKMKALALPPQTKDTAEAEHAEYKKQPDQPWIQTHMQNNNFGIKDNEGGGDCLFAVIRDAYRTRGKYVEVPELRRKLAAEATEEVFSRYKEMYTMTADSIATTSAEMRTLVDANAKLKQRLERTTEAKEQEAIIAESRRNAARFKQLKAEVALSKELLQEFHFIKNVNTLEDFREMLKSCAFWADTWAISTLERVLRVKLIILSSERFHAGEMGGVLQCGQLNDRVLEDQGVFEPEFYIMAEHTGSHYKLITYKDEALLTFREIPYDIKVMVTEKCMEHNAGPYNLIPQFRTFREEELGLKGVEEDQAVRASADHSSAAHPALYDDATVFQFYSKSMDKPLPGTGSGETIERADIPKYAALAKETPQWRKMLSNLWEPPGDDREKALFVLDDHRWRTLEHYMQGSRFRKENPKQYLQFSLDSESELSKSVAMLQDKPKDVKPDADFSLREEKEREDAQYAKYSQNSYLEDMLLNTRNAKLVHFRRGKPPITCNELMRVRHRLLQEHAKRKK
uniref:NADAR domain-containing protein n=1 Tax=viral metagenome TaxID=1070528 RepID=A0A6C0M0L1_9ZZZZ